MENATRQKLAAVAREKAQEPLSGYLTAINTDIFPKSEIVPVYTKK